MSEREEQLAEGWADKDQHPNRRSDDPFRTPLQGIMNVLVGLLTYIFMGVMLCAVVLIFVCWLLALSAYQRFGFALDPKTYAIIVTVVAVASTLAFGYFVISWIHHGSGVASGR